MREYFFRHLTTNYFLLIEFLIKFLSSLAADILNIFLKEIATRSKTIRHKFLESEWEIGEKEKKRERENKETKRKEAR